VGFDLQGEALALHQATLKGCPANHWRRGCVGYLIIWRGGDGLKIKFGWVGKNL
jgi:hypothetical protein